MINFFKDETQNCRYSDDSAGGPGSSVGTATDYGLDGPGSNPGEDEIFRPSRPGLRPTHPPVKWVPSLSRGERRQGRGADPPPNPIYCRGPRKSRAIPLLTLRTSVACKKGEEKTILLSFKI